MGLSVVISSECGVGEDSGGLGVHFYSDIIKRQLTKKFLKYMGGSEKSRFVVVGVFSGTAYLAFWVFLGRSTAWMFGSTPH